MRFKILKVNHSIVSLLMNFYITYSILSEKGFTCVVMLKIKYLKKKINLTRVRKNHINQDLKSLPTVWTHLKTFKTPYQSGHWV